MLLLLGRDVHSANGLLVLLLAPVEDVVNLLEEGEQLLSLGVKVAVDDDPGVRIPGPIGPWCCQR